LSNFIYHEGHEEHEEKQKDISHRTQRAQRKTKTKNDLMFFKKYFFVSFVLFVVKKFLTWFKQVKG
jgi:hypothetical protein